MVGYNMRNTLPTNCLSSLILSLAYFLFILHKHTPQSEVQTVKSEEDVSVDTADLTPVDSTATDTEELVLLHDECSQTHLFEALLLSTPVSLFFIDTK